EACAKRKQIAVRVVDTSELASACGESSVSVRGHRRQATIAVDLAAADGGQCCHTGDVVPVIFREVRAKTDASARATYGLTTSPRAECWAEVKQHGILLCEVGQREYRLASRHQLTS